MKNLISLIALTFSLGVYAQLHVQPNGTEDTYIYVKGNFIYVADEISLVENIDSNATDKTPATPSIALREEAQLLQGASQAGGNSNTGEISVFQEGRANMWTSNYWGSPVSTTGAAAGNSNFVPSEALFLPQTKLSSNEVNFVSGFDSSYNTTDETINVPSYWFWQYNDGDGTYGDWTIPGKDGEWTAGLGFTMKGVNIEDTTDAEQNGVANNTGGTAIPQQRYDFRGRPNSGDINLPLEQAGIVLVGNPYPSALDLSYFLLENSGTGNFDVTDVNGNTTTVARKDVLNGIAYFWEQDSSIQSHYIDNYNAGYGSFSPMGTLGAGVYSRTVFVDFDNNGNQDFGDSDGDGIQDVYELSTCGGDPNDADVTPSDTDGDGIPDCMDLDMPDSDGDGQTDIAEVLCNSPQNNAGVKADDDDNDNIPNCVDPDIDGDGFFNYHENDPCVGTDERNPNDKPTDTDGDLIPDCLDSGTANTRGEDIARRFSPIGQGFFVNASESYTGGGDITFSNRHRIFVEEDAVSNSEFKSTNTEPIPGIGVHAYYKDVTNLEKPSHVVFESTVNDSFTTTFVIGFNDNATDDADDAMDAPAYTINPNNVSLVVGDGEDSNFFSISVTPYEEDKLHPLYVQATTPGFFKFGIQEIVAYDGDEIYLVDTENDAEYDIFNDDVQLELEAGNYENRFYIKFGKGNVLDDGGLDIEESVLDVMSILQNNDLGQLTITNPQNVNVSTVDVFDILGKKVIAAKDLGAQSEYTFDTNSLSTGVYVVRFKTDEQYFKVRKVTIAN